MIFFIIKEGFPDRILIKIKYIAHNNNGCNVDRGYLHKHPIFL